MKCCSSTLCIILAVLCPISVFAQPGPIGSCYTRPYCGWVSFTGAGNGGGCYAPVLYGNPYASGYYAAPAVPVTVGPPTGIGITLFGLNILSINPTLPQATWITR